MAVTCIECNRPDTVNQIDDKFDREAALLNIKDTIQKRYEVPSINHDSEDDLLFAEDDADAYRRVNRTVNRF